MGRVVVSIIVENLEDLWEVRKGVRLPDQVRRVALSDALIDSGASGLALPTSVIQQLGLRKAFDRPVRSAMGTTTLAVYDVVQLHVEGRTCRTEVMEVPDGTPPLVGQVPLEMLDFVIDMKNHKLIGNPAHGGVQMLELY